MSITFSEVPANATASGTFIEQEAVRRTAAAGPIPQRIMLIGQPDSSYTPEFNVLKQITSVGQARTLYGNGSQLAIMVDAAFKTAGTVDVFAVPVEDDSAAETAEAVITVATPATSAGTLSFYIGGVRVAVSIAESDDADTIAGKIVAAVNANLLLPVTAEALAAEVTLTAKWGGESGNQINVALNITEEEQAASPEGVTFSGTFPETLTSGAENPDITDALDAMGNTWITTIACPYVDETSLGSIKMKGDALSNPIENKMFIAFVGYNGNHADFLTEIADYNSQWISIVPVPLSQSAQYEIAASVAGAAARGAQVDPARPARTLALTGISAATEHWDYTARNQAVLAGGSTTLTGVDGLVRIEDLVTTYTEDSTGNPDSAWRFVETVYNIQSKLYQLDVTFSSTPFNRSIVVDDNSTTQKPYAIRPKTVKAFAIQLIDNWINEAWSRERDSIVAGLEAEIDATNPGRINLLIPDVLAAGLKVMAVKYEWAFQPVQE